MCSHSHAFPLVYELRVDIPTAETRWVSITVIIIIEMTSTTSITTCSRWPLSHPPTPPCPTSATEFPYLSNSKVPSAHALINAKS